MVRSPIEILSEQKIKAALRDLPLGGIRYYESTTSTNDMAQEWAFSGGPDLGLVFAEEQTAGRGRGNRQWITKSGTALAFSLVMKPLMGEAATVSLFSGLGALAVSEMLWAAGYHPEIKWPNDVLINHRKVCGVLAEAVWVDQKPTHFIIGIGLNVRLESVPTDTILNFPATSLEAEMAAEMNRISMLRETIVALLYWRGLISNEIFLRTWEKRLAFRGEQVEVLTDGKPALVGILDGLETDASLRLRASDGQNHIVQFGEVHLRPAV